MTERLKKCLLAICLFVFLFFVVGGGFHLDVGGAFAAALTATPLVIYAFNHRSAATHRQAPACSVAHGNEHSLGCGELEE